jgi:hypothetical protein
MLLKWFHEKRLYLEALENQLKALEKAVDTVISQRKTLAEACGDFSASLHSLATVELSPALSGPLEGLSELQMRIRELYDRQAQQDVLTLGIVIDEYIRMIGSCKMAFTMREKSYYSWHAAEADLAKKKSNQDKLMRQGRSQTDRLNQLSAEVSDAEKRAHQARLLFDDMGRVLRQELDRFEKEKVEEFKSGVETYLESAVEAQKEVRVSRFSSNRIFTMFSSLRFGRRISCGWMLRRRRQRRQSRRLRASRSPIRRNRERHHRRHTKVWPSTKRERLNSGASVLDQCKGIIRRKCRQQHTLRARHVSFQEPDEARPLFRAVLISTVEWS